MLILDVFQTTITAETLNPTPVLSETDQGLLIIQAKDLELKHIITQFKTVKALRFTGLSDFMEEKITLFYTGSGPDIVKKLLKSLDVHNFAFTFNGEQLVSVTVLPPATTSGMSGKSEVPEPDLMYEEETTPEKLNSSTVLIQKVIPDSQGEALELAKNDYIIAYNGHKIPNVRKLIQYVRKYKEEESVNLVIVRDERVLEYTLQGGIIGVQIVTASINFDALEYYYKEILFETDN